ncbi:neuralized-like protein 2 [Lytechinus variegatus]|uniref:neuralized-like protein 2 n=1 Tax=Lytechinus variegatus TaxID=7654 RepID=UPI001BB22277|nr:neuralized-like protein 2 [Lytechinus variegatus]XP_041455061.1 neuralized-like protein 2 [Lytechinus variegatus]
MPLYRFHENHGVNVRRSEDGEVAKRTSSFANAITFSENSIQPGEIFMVEVDEQESGWSGHLRCGLTQHCPSRMAALAPGDAIGPAEAIGDVIRIPQYSMPDLTSMGKSWIFAITKHHNKVPRTIQDDDEEQMEASSFIQNFGNALQVGNKILPQSLLVKDFCHIDLETPGHSLYKNGKQFLATSIGSRIGITYEIQTISPNEQRANMHLIINGEDQGSSPMDNADLESPFYAIVDVYGTTKQVRIVQLNYVPTLQECCRMRIRTCIKENQVARLPLPAKLKRFLRFEPM